MFEQIEQMRKEECRKVLWVAIPVALLSLPFVIWMPFETKIPTIFGCVIVNLLVDAFMVSHGLRKVEKAYKDIFLTECLEKNFSDVTMDYERGFTEDQIRYWHILNLYNRFYSDDYISGTYLGIPFECSDVKIQQVTKTGKTTTTVTHFQGTYLKMPLQKEFDGWMVIREREFLDNGNPQGFFSELPKLERVKLEDEIFNEKFSIYSSDGHMTFYLLTPGFVERMLKLERRYEGRCIFGFINNQLHVALDSRVDHFEIGLFSPIDEIKFREHQQQVEEIKGMIELVAKECGVR